MNKHAKRYDYVHTELVKEKSKLYEKRAITTPQDAYDFFAGDIDYLDTEHMILGTLTVKNEPIVKSIISKGTLNSSTVSARDIVKIALLSNAACVLIAHNHPSGVLKPSRTDIEFTKSVKAACNLFNIKLLDHLIIHQGKYMSMNSANYI